MQPADVGSRYSPPCGPPHVEYSRPEGIYGEMVSHMRECSTALENTRAPYLAQPPREVARERLRSRGPPCLSCYHPAVRMHQPFDAALAGCGCWTWNRRVVVLPMRFEASLPRVRYRPTVQLHHLLDAVVASLNTIASLAVRAQGRDQFALSCQSLYCICVSSTCATRSSHCRSRWPRNGGCGCPPMQMHHLGDAAPPSRGCRGRNRLCVALLPVCEALAMGAALSRWYGLGMRFVRTQIAGLLVAVRTRVDGHSIWSCLPAPWRGGNWAALLRRRAPAVASVARGSPSLQMHQCGDAAPPSRGCHSWNRRFVATPFIGSAGHGGASIGAEIGLQCSAPRPACYSGGPRHSPAVSRRARPYGALTTLAVTSRIGWPCPYVDGYAFSADSLGSHHRQRLPSHWDQTYLAARLVSALLWFPRRRLVDAAPTWAFGGRPPPLEGNPPSPPCAARPWPRGAALAGAALLAAACAIFTPLASSAA